jgi:predicted flap endonuclease-1-like 5' DNA nuclease
MSRLTNVEGIGEILAGRLSVIGIRSTDALLSQGATAQGRAAIAEKTLISEKLILEWVNHADLFRVRGIGSQYADLLEEAGVDTVVELARRNPENLHQKLQMVNQEKNLVRKVPTLFQVKNWVEQAARLPGLISY